MVCMWSDHNSDAELHASAISHGPVVLAGQDESSRLSFFKIELT
jgi:hypothetical protein